MSTVNETSDAQLLDLLRKRESASVPELATATLVTATAVRQRLARLMRQGLVAREATRRGRGRPQHRYSLTALARRQVGSNFTDLAMVLWKEIRSIPDLSVRRGLLERLATHMADMYGTSVTGDTASERMESIRTLFAERQIPFEVEGFDVKGTAKAPVLIAHDCPYPTLAEVDRGVCAMERSLLSKLVAQPMRLAECRLDGHSCCRFETNPASDTLVSFTDLSSPPAV